MHRDIRASARPPMGNGRCLCRDRSQLASPLGCGGTWPSPRSGCPSFYPRPRLLFGEVFGAGNFVAEVIRQKAYSPRNDIDVLSTDQGYILVYSRDVDWQANRLPRLVSRGASVDCKSARADPLPRPLAPHLVTTLPG